MPIAAFERIEALQGQVRAMQRRDLGQSARRAEHTEAQLRERAPKPNPTETATEDRAQPPTDFSTALGVVKGLQTQIRSDPVASLATASANLDKSPGARQILSQIEGPESAA